MRYLFLLFFTLNMLFAIVDIKPVDVGEKEQGFSGEVLLALSNYRGNTNTDATDVGTTLRYDTNKSVTFMKGSYNYGEANGVRNINKAFVHVRNIYEFLPKMDNELFYQLQSNEFQNLVSRELLGIDERFHVGDPIFSGRGYLGVGLMHVREIETGKSVTNYERYNIYLSYKFAPRPNITLAFIAYYQPRLDDFSDYLVLSTGQIDIVLTQKLTLKMTLNYSEDSQPAAGVEPYDFSQKTALSYKF